MWKAESKAIETSNEKMGCVGVRLMRPAEYRKANGVKGQAARRGYRDYLEANGVVPKQELLAYLGKPDVVITGAKRWDSGAFNVSGTELGEKEAEKPAVDVVALQSKVETQDELIKRLTAENTALKASAQPATGSAKV